MTFCRCCEVSWVGSEVCWIKDCGRVGEAGGFPKAWLSAGDPFDAWRAWAEVAKGWRAGARDLLDQEAS